MELYMGNTRSEVTADILRKRGGEPDTKDLMVWDRLDHEPDKAWEYFKTYRDMGGARSIAKVAEKYGTSRPNIHNISKAYAWRMRVAAYDTEMDRLDQVWLLTERKKAKIRHAKQAMALSNKWVARLTQLDPSELSPSEVIRYADIATRMEREALSMHDQIDVNVTGMPEVVSVMSSEESRVRLQQLQRELTERLRTGQPSSGKNYGDDPLHVDDPGDSYHRNPQYTPEWKPGDGYSPDIREKYGLDPDDVEDYTPTTADPDDYQVEPIERDEPLPDTSPDDGLTD